MHTGYDAPTVTKPRHLPVTGSSAPSRVRRCYLRKRLNSPALQAREDFGCQRYGGVGGLRVFLVEGLGGRLGLLACHGF